MDVLDATAARSVLGRADLGPFFRLHLAAKAALAVAQTVGGWLTGSTSLLADGGHNLADLLSGIVAWLGYRFASRPPDQDHHYGHGNAEALASAVVGVALFGASAGILWRAIASTDTLLSPTHGWVALGVAGGSIVTNELLARRTARLAREHGSPALGALARDDRADTLSSSLVVVAVLLGLFGVAWVERVVAAGIGLWIAYMAWRSLSVGLDVLMDRVDDPTLRERARELAAGVEGVRGVQTVRIHPLGTHQRVDMEISVDGSLTVTEGHHIAHSVEGAIVRALPEVREVQVHVNPAPVPPEE